MTAEKETALRPTAAPAADGPGGLTEAVLGLPPQPPGPLNAPAQAPAPARAAEPPAPSPQPAADGHKLAEGWKDIIADLVQRVEQLEGAGRTARLLEAYIETMSKELRLLTARMDRLAQHMVATVGFRVRESFECEGCGSRHNVAARITCTNCQRESWWGWWPEEKT